MYLHVFIHLGNITAISLKIPQRQSEAVNRRTDNTMTKEKKTKGQIMIYKTLHRKLKTRKYILHVLQNGRLFFM